MGPRAPGSKGWRPRTRLPRRAAPRTVGSAPAGPSRPPAVLPSFPAPSRLRPSSARRCRCSDRASPLRRAPRAWLPTRRRGRGSPRARARGLLRATAPASRRSRPARSRPPGPRQSTRRRCFGPHESTRSPARPAAGNPRSSCFASLVSAALSHSTPPGPVDSGGTRRRSPQTALAYPGSRSLPSPLWPSSKPSGRISSSRTVA